MIPRDSLKHDLAVRWKTLLRAALTWTVAHFSLA